MKSVIQEHSVRSLYIEVYYNEFVLSNATGFIVNYRNENFLITNRHVVTGRDNNTGKCLSEQKSIPNKIKIFHNGATLDEWVQKEELLVDEDGRPLWIEHPYYKEKMDVVAIRLTKLDGVKVYAYNLAEELGSHLKVDIPDLINVIGFPFGKKAGDRNDRYLAIWMSGYIASEPSINYNQLPCFLIDCRTRSGQSGSPVIAYRAGQHTMTDGSIVLGAGITAKLLGVYSGRINKEADIGIVWKIEELVRFFERNNNFYGDIKYYGTVQALGT